MIKDNPNKQYEDRFRTNLNSFIKAHGLYQKELAAELGVSRETVNNWINGKCFPHPRQAAMIAKFFQTDPLVMGSEIVTSKTAA